MCFPIDYGYHFCRCFHLHILFSEIRLFNCIANFIPIAFLFCITIQGQTILQGTHNAARKLVDGISYVADTVSWVGAKPTKMVTQWMTDQIAPPYWKPNSLISVCIRLPHPIGNLIRSSQYQIAPPYWKSNFLISETQLGILSQIDKSLHL